MSAFKTVGDILKKWFLSGALIVVPLILTYAVLKFLFDLIDGLLGPLVEHWLGYRIPGLGIIITLLIILLAGFFTRSFVGNSIYKRTDRLLAKTPVIRIFYMGAKQLIEAVTVPSTRSFKEVVIFEYMRKGIYAIGFATTRIKIVEDDSGAERKLVGIFIPSTPTPVSGVVIFLPEDDVYHLNMTVEEALKLMVSGGIVSPDEISYIGAKRNETNEGDRIKGKLDEAG